MIPTWLKLSSIVCSSAGDTLSCAGRPTGPGISSLTYTTTSGHHRRYLPDFPEITGQSFRNPHTIEPRLGARLQDVPANLDEFMLPSPLTPRVKPTTGAPPDATPHFLVASSTERIPPPGVG